MDHTEVARQAYEFYQNYQLPIHLLLGAAIIGVACWLSRETQEWWNAIPRRRGKMLRRARREFVRKEATYAFVDHVEEGVFAGLYTRAEANELYRDMKKAFPIKELFPSAELLKENIRQRLAAHIHEPVPLSDRKEKPARKPMFAKLAPN